jgi:predicted lipoprotein with Yx(FWY)xxD motif
MRRFMTLMCVPAIIVMLAACGSSSSSKSAKTSSTTAKTSSTSAGSATAVVKTASSDTLGKIVVTNTGKTVYTLTGANGQTVACASSDGCLTVWPAVLLPAGATKATGGAGVTGLGDIAAAGGQQVTLGGKPVYTFSGDTASGDAKGDGITSFGGTWHVVKVGSATSATTATTSGSSSGY